MFAFIYYGTDGGWTATRGEAAHRGHRRRAPADRATGTRTQRAATGTGTSNQHRARGAATTVGHRRCCPWHGAQLKLNNARAQPLQDERSAWRRHHLDTHNVSSSREATLCSALCSLLLALVFLHNHGTHSKRLLAPLHTIPGRAFVRHATATLCVCANAAACDVCTP